jgi:4-hydroxybenzoate polyprenyltransferase
MTEIRNFLSLVKFSHTIFAMPFAIIGFFIAVGKDGYPFNWKVFMLVLCCMVLARNSAMAFNRWLDANFDKLNPRTAIREIPSGVISRSNALWFVILNCMGFVLATWFINPLCFFLSPVALFVILFYSYTKRFTALCHLVLGLGLSLAPIGAYLAVTGKFSWVPIFISLAVLTWVAGFDVIYALQDEDFDKHHQLHSIPVWLGKERALYLSNFLHLITVVSLSLAGYMGEFGLWYWIGVGVFAALLIYQHLLVKPHDLSKVNLAFFTTNGIASVVFAGFVLVDIFISH